MRSQINMRFYQRLQLENANINPGCRACDRCNVKLESGKTTFHGFNNSQLERLFQSFLSNNPTLANLFRNIKPMHLTSKFPDLTTQTTAASRGPCRPPMGGFGCDCKACTDWADDCFKHGVSQCENDYLNTLATACTYMGAVDPSAGLRCLVMALYGFINCYYSKERLYEDMLNYICVGAAEYGPCGSRCRS